MSPLEGGGPTWIGADCGASGVRVHEVRWERDGAWPGQARLGAAEHAETWPPAPGFRPLPLEAQRAGAEPSAAERAHAARWIETLARAIASVARSTGGRSVRLAIAAPGVKTADGRGIALALHAPRIPRLLDDLERRLDRGGIAVDPPLGALIGDGLACAWAEVRAEGGALAGVRDAYWLGGGTGLAEALVASGVPAPVEPRLPRAWEIAAPGGASYDDLLSARGINRRYAALRGVAEGAREAFPEERASADREAAAVLAQAGDDLARFLLERLRSLRELSPALEPERAVVGARLGELFARSAPLRERALAGLAAAELPLGLAPGEWLVASRLRAAAALGAAAAARFAREAAGA